MENTTARTAWIAEQNRRHKERTVRLIAEWHDGGLSGHAYSRMLRGARRFGLDIMAPSN
jgi:hypothetical protein